MDSKNIVVIGGGHNGLVSAAYLARAGHKVSVLESRCSVGGAASSDTTTFPGYTLSTASYLNSLFLPEIVSDLDLKRFGYEVILRNPSSFTPLPDGRTLLLGPDMDANMREIAKFSSRDALAYPRYEKELGEIADWVAKLMTMTPPNIPPCSWRDIENLCALARHTLRLNPVQMYRLTKLLHTNPAEYLDQWFESDILKATLLTDALIGATKMSGYVLLHHVMGEAGGARGVWGYMRGGMGGISSALRASCEEHGVTIHCNAHALRITLTGDKTVSGVVSKIHHESWKNPKRNFDSADVVISAISPTYTFATLLSSHEGIVRDVRRAIATKDNNSASMKINCVLSGVPDFYAMRGTEIGPQHKGTIHISPSVGYILDALKDYRDGTPSREPMLELTIPSALDDTLAPPLHHVMNIFLQCYPYDNKPDSEQRKMQYFEGVVTNILRRYIANWDAIYVDAQVLSPHNLEQEFGMVGGNIFHGGMGLSQLFSFRPIRGMANYRTPIKGLYLSGAGTHPGGGVTGACGYNAAREVLYDLAPPPEATSRDYMFPG